jgi:hypothetical protein
MRSRQFHVRPLTLPLGPLAISLIGDVCGKPPIHNCGAANVIQFLCNIDRRQSAGITDDEQHAVTLPTETDFAGPGRYQRCRVSDMSRRHCVSQAPIVWYDDQEEFIGRARSVIVPINQYGREPSSGILCPCDDRVRRRRRRAAEHCETHHHPTAARCAHDILSPIRRHRRAPRPHDERARHRYKRTIVATDNVTKLFGS